jgi:hypothetical protein
VSETSVCKHMNMAKEVRRRITNANSLCICSVMIIDTV